MVLGDYIKTFSVFEIFLLFDKPNEDHAASDT